MTGIADLYLYIRRGEHKSLWNILCDLFIGRYKTTQFVVLAWKRTGSNLLCGILYHHPEIVMHNELYNTIDIFTYYPELFDRNKWNVLTRDLHPTEFLNDVWMSVANAVTTKEIENGIVVSETISNAPKKAVGFKSFPEHWTCVRNERAWTKAILQNIQIKKIILKRDDELKVFVSILRADETGMYLGTTYPANLKVHIDPASFQRFLNNYRDTYQNRYNSRSNRDTFWVTYEQLTNEDDTFRTEILPKLWKFLNVDPNIGMRKLTETRKQSDPNEDMSTIISNYDELEFCFRHSDVSHFAKQRNDEKLLGKTTTCTPLQQPALVSYDDELPLQEPSSWSILLPICSRGKSSQCKRDVSPKIPNLFSNRFLQLSKESQHDPGNQLEDLVCWSMLDGVCTTLHHTSSEEQMLKTEVIVGIDVDDQVFFTSEAKTRIKKMFVPCHVKFVDIQKTMYGKVCSIWSHLGRHSANDYVVLLGDDIRLLDSGWQAKVVRAFHAISRETKLPLGAACVCLNDVSFPGFPTFPVVHRWHIDLFMSILPKQFVNQGGDPYLYELYSRFNTACFVAGCRLENTIGGDGDARYRKYEISWQGQILTMNLKKLQKELDSTAQRGFVMDIVVPTYRINNLEIITRIAKLRASVKAYVKFWFVVDNPDLNNLQQIKDLAYRLNVQHDGNYFMNVVHYSANRGASFARNVGYNQSTADWILFLDDDVIPDDNIIDAYIGAVRRYPTSKVFVGYTALPDACNLWTEMLKTCNVGYFYSIAKKMVHPSWGVTANLMVYGSRFNRTIQFKNIYPKTGGGEDIDFVYQYKDFYDNQPGLTAAVPEAVVKHPWWRNSGVCYSQITGWAKGDSLCITEWPSKTFLTFPNWVEHISFIVLPMTVYYQRPVAGIVAAFSIFLCEHIGKTINFYLSAIEVTGRSGIRTGFVAFGAGTIISSQEVQRVLCIIQRCSLYSICRRVDWFDGQRMSIKLDIQLTSILTFALNIGITWLSFQLLKRVETQWCFS